MNLSVPPSAIPCRNLALPSDLLLSLPPHKGSEKNFLLKKVFLICFLDAIPPYREILFRADQPFVDWVCKGL